MLQSFITVPSVDETAEQLVARVIENEEAYLSTAASLPPLELTDDHLQHAKTILNRSTGFAEFRRSVCPMRVSDERFWNAYFTLLAAELGLKRRRAAAIARISPDASYVPSRRASVSSPSSTSSPTSVGNRSPSLAERVLDVVAPRGPGATPNNRLVIAQSSPKATIASPVTSPKLLTAAGAGVVPLIPGALPPATFTDGQDQLNAITEVASQFVASSAEVGMRLIDDVAFAFAQLADDSDEDEDGDSSNGSSSPFTPKRKSIYAATDEESPNVLLTKKATTYLTSLPCSAVELCQEVSAKGQASSKSTCMRLVNWWAPTQLEHSASEVSVNEEFSSYF